jgi:Fur family iron response transcriptional regulator
MPRTVEAAHREELRQAGLPGRGAFGHLLGLLRASPDTHLAAPEVVRLAADGGLAATPEDIRRQLETLADHGLLGRLPGSAPQTVFDTVPRPHAHLLYEDPGQIVDLDVSPETLMAILRHLLTEQPDGVEVLVRCRGDAVSAGGVNSGGLRESS